MSLESTDTIAALATPPGCGGIAVLRMSGPDSLAALHALFLPAASRDPDIPENSQPPSPSVRTDKKTFAFRPRHLHYGHVLDAAGELLDEALAVFMPGPHSATGEDVGEIHCHGGAGVTAALLEAALKAGARLAEPGEFTRRAFLNGRMDLTQAEAVAELVQASTRQGARLAAAKLEGKLAGEITSIRQALDALRIQVALAVDFPDEDAVLLSLPEFSATIQDALDAIQRLLGGFERARLWREGARAVLAGRVNAGKSSLLNALLGRARAIVSAEPGTTRDYIEESVNLGGLPVRLVDTAGLRREGGIIEAEGIRRSRDLAREADILLFVLDASMPIHQDDRDFLRAQTDLIAQGRLLLVWNKMDNVPGIESPPRGIPLTSLLAGCPAAMTSVPEEAARLLGGCPQAVVSARQGWGIEELAEEIRRALLRETSIRPDHGDIAPNLRQAELLRQAFEELVQLRLALRAAHPPDILGVHLEAAADKLDEVTGSSAAEALLDRIFSSFCIGK